MAGSPSHAASTPMLSGEVFHGDLGAQLVEFELVGKALRQRREAVEQEAAAMAARAPP